MFTLKIETDNDAFHPLHTEIARILRELADRIEEFEDDGGVIYDSNGNKVGAFERS